jgi:TonB-dependent SusC/RagA subfamily outer membrane receptor
MVDRDLDREINYLNTYFEKHQNLEVSLTVFSNTIVLKEIFQVRGGLWKELMEVINKTVYDGATSYEKLFKDDVEEFLLFSDGLDNMDVLQPPLNKPIHVITSVVSNEKRLKLISELSEGSYNKLRENVADPVANISNTSNVLNVTGRISDIEGPLKYANVINKNSNKVVGANFQGEYKIEAESGDILVFNAQGKKTVSIRIDKTDLLDIFMQNTDEALDEVVVNATVEKEVLVNTGNGMVDERRLGYDVETITKDDISNQDTDLIGAVKGQFSNLNLANQTNGKVDLTQFKGRQGGMTILGNQYGLVVVDGVPLGGSDSSSGSVTGAGRESPANAYVGQSNNMLDPSMIESITYLKGLAATNKYGSLGANGVILITTINGKGASKNKKPAKIGTTATYEGEATAMTRLANKNYINSIKDSKSTDEAFTRYLTLRVSHQEDPYFYIDIYDYFSKWNNKALSNRIISNIFEVSAENTAALRALAYKYETRNLDDAIKVYRYILKKAPKELQAYRDLALAYAENDDFKNAKKTYLKLKRYTKKIRSSAFIDLINKEEQIVNNKSAKTLKSGNTDSKTRLVFQWNNPDAEFDLNIINPKKRFFTWSHSMQDASQKISDEKKQGFFTEEFLIEPEDKGEWTFNITYYGNNTPNKAPSYLKITTYNNYNSLNETKTTKILRLDKEDVEQVATKLVKT